MADGYSGSDYIRKQHMRDVLFLNKLYKVTTDEELAEMIVISDMEVIDFNNRQKLELFFLKLKNEFITYYDMLVGLLNSGFDFDIINILKNTSMLEKCKAEKLVKNNVDLRELF